MAEDQPGSIDNLGSSALSREPGKRATRLAEGSVPRGSRTSHFNNTNAAGSVTQIGLAEAVNIYHLHPPNVQDIQRRSQIVFEKLPPGQKDFASARRELGFLVANLEVTQKLIERNPEEATRERDDLEALKTDTRKALDRIEKLAKQWEDYGTDRQQLWMDGQGNEELDDIVESLQRNTQHIEVVQQLIQDLDVLVRKYLRTRSHKSSVNEDTIDQLEVDSEQWQTARTEILATGFPQKLLDGRTAEVIASMKKHEAEGVNEELDAEQAEAYEQQQLEMTRPLQSTAEIKSSVRLVSGAELLDVEASSGRLINLAWDLFVTGSVVLTRASQIGDKNAVSYYLQRGVNPDTKDQKTWTPLHWAARNGHLQIVRALLDARATVDALTEEDFTPLHLAAAYNHTEVVKLLLEHGADAMALSQKGWSAVHQAAYYGHNQLIQFFADLDACIVNLTAPGADSPLMACAPYGNVDSCRALLKAGADPNYKDDSGLTALGLTAMYGLTDLARILIKEGADPEVRDEHGYTSLHLAAARGRADFVEFLVKERAELFVVDGTGATPLHHAAAGGSLQAVKLLLNAGAETNVRDGKGYSPLHDASFYGRTQIVRYLLDPKFRTAIDATDFQRMTPLHQASSSGYIEIVRILLNHNADIDHRDIYQWTSLHRAAYGSYVSVVKLLLEKGADVNAKNSSDWTPLHEACGQGDETIVAMLCEHGADLEVFDVAGYTPAARARLSGFPHIANYLEALMAQEMRVGNTKPHATHARKSDTKPGQSDKFKSTLYSVDSRLNPGQKNWGDPLTAIVISAVWVAVWAASTRVKIVRR